MVNNDTNICNISTLSERVECVIQHVCVEKT
jgi:hypothetical protein